MHAIIRTYSGPGAKQVFDLLQQRKAEVEGLIRPVPGFVSYVLMRSAKGGASVTVCEDKAGAEESLRVAADWIRESASGIGAGAPAAGEGTVILKLN
jgi:hypothetical protein